MYRYFTTTEYIFIVLITIYIVSIIRDLVSKQYKKIDFLLSLLILTISILGAFFYSPAFVVGESMLPTLKDKDILLINKVDRNYKKDDIVILHSKELKKILVKRIIATGGEKVELKDGKLFINDKLVNETFDTMPTYENFGPIVVPENNYFVMGDNRANSADSRAEVIGSIPKYYIIGKAINR